MEIPENCDDCPFRDVALAFCHIIKTSTSHFPSGKPINQKKRHPKCPLVEVPGPHGRLIDADALKNYIENYGHTEAFAMAQIGREGKFFLMGNIIADIDEQPTVIEAEGETDDKTNKGSSC